MHVLQRCCVLARPRSAHSPPPRGFRSAKQAFGFALRSIRRDRPMVLLLLLSALPSLQLGLPAAPQAAAAGTYTLHYVDAGSFDPPTAADDHRRLQRPEIPFWMKAATYSADGCAATFPAACVQPTLTDCARSACRGLQSIVNVTKPFNGMGYLSISQDGSKAIFASELKQPQGCAPP